MTVEQEQHKGSLQSLVELYTIDATNIGGTIYRLTPEASETPIIWKTNAYTTFPITITEEQKQMNGSLPRPILTISNVDGLLLAPLLALKDMVGAEVTLERTFEQFLDNGTSPDPNTALQLERFLVSQKTKASSTSISFELISRLARNIRKLPRRQVLVEDFPGVGNYRVRQ